MSNSEVLCQSTKRMQMYTLAFAKRPGEHDVKTKFLSRQGFATCGPEKEICVRNQTLKDQNCLVPCDGLYADILDGSLKQNVMKGWPSLSL